MKTFFWIPLLFRDKFFSINERHGLSFWKYGMPNVTRWNLCKAKCLDKQNSQRLCCRLIHLMWIRLTRALAASLRKQPKSLSHVVIETTIFRVGMRNVNPFIGLFCSLLRETIQVWVLLL